MTDFFENVDTHKQFIASLPKENLSTLPREFCDILTIRDNDPKQYVNGSHMINGVNWSYRERKTYLRNYFPKETQAGILLERS